jgi:hypothetical protein
LSTRANRSEQPIQNVEDVVLCAALQAAGERNQRRDATLRRHTLNRLSTDGACIPSQHFEPACRDLRHVEIVNTELTCVSESSQRIDESIRIRLSWSAPEPIKW